MADNYTQVPNWMLAKLYKNDLTGRELKVLLYLIRKLIGFHKESDKIPYRQIAEATGIDRNNVMKVVQSLEKKGWVSVRRKDKCTNILRLKGGVTSNTRGGVKKCQKVVSPATPSKENQKSGLSSSPPLVGVDSQDKINNINNIWEEINNEDDEYE